MRYLLSNDIMNVLFTMNHKFWWFLQSQGISAHESELCVITIFTSQNMYVLYIIMYVIVHILFSRIKFI